jgi:ABC-type glycerol-3-phosphate transport system substrate-binding protein
MTSGDSTFDIFILDLSYQDFQSLLKKGYCMDLSGSAKITEEMGKMYPFLQTAVQKDGKYYAIPTSLYAYGFSIVPKAWENAGITDQIPTSFMGLIDFLNWWLDEGENAHPDLQLMDQVTDFRQTLFEMALSMYVADCQANGQDLTLNTPVFKEMLTALDNLDTDALNDTLPAADDNATGGRVMLDDNESTLFNSYGDWLNIYDNGGYEYSRPLILSLEDGGAQHIPVYVSAMFINPNTKNPEMAVKYAENMLDHMDKAQHIMMFPDDNNPIPVQNYDKMIESWQTSLDKQKEALKTAKPEDVKDIQATIDNLQDLLTNKDKYRWQVSQDGIDQYRNLASLCFTATPNLINLNVNNGDSELSTLISRYLQKQVSLDQFLSDADQKIRMIQMEQQ